MNPIFILLAMIFLHIIDDFVLQPICLSRLKQREFWEKNAPSEQYKNDYKMALAVHSFSWAFAIMLPIAYVTNFDMGWLFIAYLFNAVIHYYIDDLKANEYAFNLIQDQSLHLIQIVMTFGMYCLVWVV